MSILKDAYDILNDLRGLAKKHKNQELMDKVIDMQDAFYQIREDMENLKAENQKLKNRIQNMENTSELEKDLETIEEGMLIRKSEKAANKEIFYCPACWNNHKKLMPLTVTGTIRHCTNCKMVFR